MPIFREFSNRERRILLQSFTILEDLRPYWTKKGEERESDANFWKEIHKRVANELGKQWLHHPVYESSVGIGDGRRTETKLLDHIEICRRFMTATFSDTDDADTFIKERLSLLEIGLRKAWQDLESFKAANEKFGGLLTEGFRKLDSGYASASDEVNSRFQAAKLPLDYHNGFIQLKTDDKVNLEIEQPFWSLVSDPIWENVDIDMKGAVDQRDSGGKDPALFACKALESAIKIISRSLGYSTGKEIGAGQFIDGLTKGVTPFLMDWEAEQLKSYFSKVRNPLGHGPGDVPMPSLDYEQSSLAIGIAMCWIKLIVDRFNTRKKP